MDRTRPVRALGAISRTIIAVAALAAAGLACDGPPPAERGSLEAHQAALTSVCMGCKSCEFDNCSGCTSCSCEWGKGSGGGEETKYSCINNIQNKCAKDQPVTCSGNKCWCGPVSAVTLSCGGFCGVYDRQRSCQCDIACTTYGDCCPDAAALCPHLPKKTCTCDVGCSLSGTCCATCL